MRKRFFGHGNKKKSSKRGGQSRQFKPGNKSGGKTFTGRVQKKEGGFAFILPHEPGQKDAYVPKAAARTLMNGDVVQYRLHRNGRFTDAEITKVVERAQTHVLGMLRNRGGQPLLEDLQHEFYQVSGRIPNKANNTWVRAKIEQYPTPRLPALVSVATVIGPELLPAHDYLVGITRYGLHDTFGNAVIQEAENLHSKVEEETTPPLTRTDLRHLPFVTIDGADAKDFDDAILVAPHGSSYRLYVAIADVSFFVRPGTELDREARNRSTSVYFPGFCLPMLPEELSNDLCSLNPQTDKLVLVAEMDFDSHGVRKGVRFCEAIIKTAARLTYDQVQSFFSGDKNAVPQVTQDPLQTGYKLFQALLTQRTQRGVMDFQLSEAVFDLDSDKKPIKIYPRPQLEAHKLIEEFMIAANSAVAEALRKSGAGALYRVHETPGPDSMENLNALLRSLGFSQVLSEINPKAFSELLASTAGKKGASTLHKAVLRSQKQARYEPDPKGHFGLALMDYTHFTSPIRRYPDLIVHRALRRFILKEKSSDKEVEDYTALGKLTSERERRAMEAERFVSKRKQCWFMKEHIGAIFDGTINGVIEAGAFIEIPEHAVEGFVPIDAFLGHYVFDERKTALRRSPGHSTLSIGDKVTVQVVAASVEDGTITLAQVEDDS